MKDLTQDQKDAFWDRIDDVTAGMLHTDGDRVVPMSHFTDPARRALWFITAEGTECHRAAQSGSSVQYVVADDSARIYARVEGRLSVSDDKAKLDALWSPVAAAWFKDGREDANVRLVQFIPARAEVWLTEGGAGFLYQIARASLTGKTPDAGDHGVVRF